MPDPFAPPPHEQPGQRKHFGRLRRFDPKSMNYLIRANRLGFWRTLTARLRTEVHHRVWWQGDQGSSAQCTAFGVLGMFEAGTGHARSRGKVLHGYNRPIVSPRAVYQRAQQLDPWPGSETEEPMYEGSSGTAAAQALKELGLITGYDWEFDDAEVAERAIFTAPLGFGIDWTRGMMLDGGPRSRWEDAVVVPSGHVVGGHFVAIVGYDKNRKGGEWDILNSWSRQWGYEGHCYMSRDSFANRLVNDGELIMLRDAADVDILAALALRKVA